MSEIENKSKKINIGKEIIEWVICFIIAYVIYLVVSNLLGTIAGVKQSSMNPTAKEGDRVVVSKIANYTKSYKREDIVIIEAPEIMYMKNGVLEVEYGEHFGLDYFAYKIMGIGKKSYIKRIIGLPGEHIYISEGGKVYINGTPLEEQYLNGIATPRTGRYYDIQIPEGYIFVMGDNRQGSCDSRELGIIPFSKVEGKVIGRVWPLNKIGKI